MTRDVEAVVAKLTEAQRAICTAGLFGMTTSAFYPGRVHRACRSLVDLGLLTETQDNVGNPMFRWTPFGLAVRAHILAQDKSQ